MLRSLRGTALALVCVLSAASAAVALPIPAAFSQAVLFAGAKTSPRVDVQTQRRAAPKKKKTQTRSDPDDDGKAPRIWRLTHNITGQDLTFGNRNGDPIVTFSCQPGSGEIRVIAFTAARGTRRGDAARLRFTNGRQRLEIAGTAFADGRQDRIDVGGVTSAIAQFAELFRGGETMIVEVPGRKVGVSLKTLGKKAEQFAAVCR